ncbi:MAG: InlB B-repeat-containing protein, partial [Acholeplasmatales bacterium]|nr:InlB B-repeat-containing protein [Acholeplasmatales bacterium]
DTGEVMLIAFSKEGKKKDTIVIPTLIKGRKVTTLGYMKDYLLDDGNGIWTADFSGASYSKIYFHCYLTTYRISSGYDIFCCSTITSKFFYGAYLRTTDLMIVSEKSLYKCYIPFLCKEGYETRAHYNYNSANVVYYLNDDTDSTFFCDDCDGTKVNVIPPDPYRDGYKFIGWYKEKEGINEFDFEKEIIPSKEYDVENNYILNETSIYAKWEKK